MRLESKVALVTGAASGNGKAIAKLYAKERAKVVGVDLDEDGVRVNVCEITSEHGTAIAVQADVTKEEDVPRIVDKAVSQFETLDILVNNAGIFDMLLPAGYVSDKLWNKVIDINLTAPMRIIRKALSIFEKQGCSVIINIASIAGIVCRTRWRSRLCRLKVRDHRADEECSFQLYAQKSPRKCYCSRSGKHQSAGK
jgi:NAD(P)-dependent dehydrogenase (short-subunit alcohol dehydrogenase family)